MPGLVRPLNAQLEVTDKCNFKCRHCYHLDFDSSVNSQDISDEKIMLIAEKLVESRIFGITLTGGEPLIRKGLVKRLVKYFNDHDTDTSLNTNLLLLDQETLHDLMSNQLNHILISCPSSDPELYRYMTGGGNLVRFIENLKMVIDSNQAFAVNMVVNQNNFHSIKETAIFLQKQGVKLFGATPMGLNISNPDLATLLRREQVASLSEELLWLKENLGLSVDIFEAMPKCVFPDAVREKEPYFMKRRCQAGKTIVSIGNKGDVRPCSHNPDVYGNILQDSLEKIWTKMADWRDNQQTPVRCMNCKLEEKCHGGCRITAKAFTGANKGEDPWMVSPLFLSDQSKIAESDIILDPSMQLVVSKMFRWRNEGKENWLITSVKNSRNATIVTRPLFEFIKSLRDKSPIILEDIVNVSGCSFDDVEFQRVIKLLLRREFVFLKSQRKEVKYNV